MKILSASETKRLSSDDWNRIHRALRIRFADFDNGNIANIAFGLKRSKDRIHSGPIRSVRFLVRHKRTPRAKIDRIAPNVSVKFRYSQSGRLVQVVIPTDVEEVGAIVPTGASVADNPSGQVTGTTGLVVDVTHQSEGRLMHTRGFLTVGHPFEDVSVPRSVTGKRRDGFSRSVPGIVRKRSFPRRNSKYDGAFAEAQLVDLSDGNYLRNDGPSTATLSESELIEICDNDEVGQILRTPPRGPANIEALDYIPQTLPTFDRHFGVMRGVLRGVAEQEDVLFQGTSGSIWRIRGKIASLQFAAEVGFRVGYSQAVFALLDEWLKDRFNAIQVKVLNSF